MGTEEFISELLTKKQQIEQELLILNQSHLKTPSTRRSDKIASTMQFAAILLSIPGIILEISGNLPPPKDGLVYTGHAFMSATGLCLLIYSIASRRKISNTQANSGP